MPKYRKLSYDEKEKARKQKEDMIIAQDYKCYVCGNPFTLSDPPEMSHRIIQKYREIYGTEIIDHPLNTPICHKSCNSEVILWPDKQSGKDLINMIRKEIKNGNY